MYRLLLVSDKEEVRTLYEAFSEWENLGFEKPVVVANAQQGIERLKHGRFDAVSSSPAEQEKRTGCRIHLQLLLNDCAQSVYRLAHIRVI